MAQLNANNDNTWSMNAATEEEALLATVVLNTMLKHPELSSVEEFNVLFAQQTEDEEEK